VSDIRDALDEFQSDIKQFKASHEQKLTRLTSLVDEAHAQLEKLNATSGSLERRHIGEPIDWKTVRLGSDPDGGYLANDQQASFVVDRLRQQSVMLRAGVQVFTMSGASLSIPTIKQDPSAAWRGEGETFAASDPQFGRVRAAARKLIAYCVASREAVEDSSPLVGEVLTSQMTRALAEGLDYAMLEGIGAGNQPLGLKHTDGIEEITTLGTDGSKPTDLDFAADAIAQLIENGANPDEIVAVLHPRDWRNLLKIKLGTSYNKSLLQSDVAGVGQAPVRSLYGAPVWLTSLLSTDETRGGSSGVCSSAYFFDRTQVAFVRRADIRIERDSSRYFDSDSIAFRGVLRGDFVVLNPKAVARVVGFKVS
jgi:HK97 family phage major capsid protein